ncbi:hypothetical protein HMPREF9554_01588 [Treponema phagedenis F0421]|nr:hypothetical protein HMPREF9554_01588 [Treponema phagedenis F0421]
MILFFVRTSSIFIPYVIGQICKLDKAQSLYYPFYDTKKSTIVNVRIDKG